MFRCDLSGFCFFFQAEDGIRYLVRSRGLGDVYKRQGTSLFVQPDIIQQKLREGDRLILCSDGVWSVIEDEEFAQVTNEASSVEEISRNLINLALDKNTDDNASVVVFHLRKLIPVSSGQEVQNEKSTGWFQKLRNLVS